MPHCCVPNCAFVANKCKNSTYKVYHPKFVRKPEEKEHHENLMNILLAVSKLPKPQIIHMIHRGSAKICEAHFLPKDLKPFKNGKRLTIGAIPMLNMPRIVNRVIRKLKRRKQKQQLLLTQATQTENGIESSELQIDDLEDNSMEFITIPKNTPDSSLGQEIIVSLKDQMWLLVSKLNQYCNSLLNALSEENLEKFVNKYVSISNEVDNIRNLYLKDQINMFKEETEINREEYDRANDEDNLEPHLVLNGEDNPPVKHCYEMNFHALSKHVFTNNKGCFWTAVDIPQLTIRECRTEENAYNKNPPKKSHLKTIPVSAPIPVPAPIPVAAPPLPALIPLTLNSKDLLINDTITENLVPKKKKLKYSTKEEVEHYLKFIVGHEEWGQAFKCESCSKLFKTWYMLRKHDRKSHLKADAEKCKVCDKYSSNLKSHMLSHTQERKYVCETCGAKFIRSGHLKAHVLQITACTFPSYECNICHERISDEEESIKHLRGKHLNNSCDLCRHEVSEKCFEHKFTTLKLYKCKFCEESFSFKNEYKPHLKSKHSVELSKTWLQCSDCLKYFPFQQALLNHKASCSATRMFLCEYCSRTFPSKTSLKSHQINKHNS